MTTVSAKTPSVILALVITAVIAIAGWISYFFAQQEASKYQQQVQQIASGDYTRDEIQAALIAKKTSEISEALEKRAQASAEQTATSKTVTPPATTATQAPSAPPSSTSPPKYNKLVMAEREKALKELDSAKAKIGTVLKQKESAVEEGKKLKEQLSQAAADIEKLKQSVEMARKQESDKFQMLRQQLEQELEQKQVTISQLKDRMTVVNVTAEILFSSGSAVIKPEGQKVLDLIAETLNKHPDRMISIEGHTDNKPIAGDLAYPTNWELSSARAAAAVRYLEDKARVEPTRMQIVGHGQHNPTASNETAEGRATNRRIEIILLPPSKL